jgi:hypothetical protein
MSTFMPLRLRPTMLSDLDFVISVEQDAQNLPFITPWERIQHEGAVRFPDFRHFIVEAGAGYQSAGFVILQELDRPTVLLRRIAAAHGAVLLDLEAHPEIGALEMWAEDKVHLRSRGHRFLGYRAADALGVPIEYFLESGSADTKKEPIDTDELPEKERRFAELFISLSPSNRHTLLVIAEALLRDQSGNPDHGE